MLRKLRHIFFHNWSKYILYYWNGDALRARICLECGMVKTTYKYSDSIPLDIYNILIAEYDNYPKEQFKDKFLWRIK